MTAEWEMHVYKQTATKNEVMRTQGRQRVRILCRKTLIHVVCGCNDLKHAAWTSQLDLCSLFSHRCVEVVGAQSSNVQKPRKSCCQGQMLAGRVWRSPADLLILLLPPGFPDSSASASSAAEGSKRGSLCRPATVGRKNGAFAGFLGGCTGLLRACTHIHNIT